MKAGIVPPPPKPDYTFSFEFSREELARLDAVLNLFLRSNPEESPGQSPGGTFATQVCAEIDRLLKVPQ